MERCTVLLVRGAPYGLPVLHLSQRDSCWEYRVVSRPCTHMD